MTSLGHGRFEAETDNGLVTLELMATSGTSYRVTHDGLRRNVNIVVSANTVTVFWDGRSYSFDLPDSLAGTDADQAGGDAVIAPMPGLVKVVSTKAGATVSKGDALLVLEAMKMEHTLTAPRDGVVAEVLASVDDQVTDGMLLLALEPEDG